MALSFDAIDDKGVGSAVNGLIQATGSWQAGSLAGLARIGEYLTGTWDPPAGQHGPDRVGYGEWATLIGRIGAVALRAAAPSTRPEHRERLLAFLDVWSRTVFVDAQARLRTGIVWESVWKRPAIRNEHGATIALCHLQDSATVLEFRTGDAEAPGLGPIEEVVEPRRADWDSAGRIRQLVDLVRTRGPMPWDPEAVALLVDATGMSRAGAALLLAANPGARRSTEPFLDPEERRVLGLGAAEVKAGCAELLLLTDEQRLDLFADALPPDPADLWTAAGPRHVATHIAAAWRARFGHHVPVPEPSRALIAALDPRRPAAELCTVLAHPAGEPLIAEDLDTWPHASGSGIGLVAGSAAGDLPRRMRLLLRDVATLVPTVYAELPAGDPLREGLPDLIEGLRARLSHPGLLLDAADVFPEITVDDLRERFGPTPYPSPEPLTAPAFDDGLTVAVGAPPPTFYGRHKHRARLYFRPALLDVDAEQTKRLADERGYYGRDVIAHVRLIRGAYFTHVIERVRSGALPAGTYESNPAASVPELVGRVAESLTLSPDAATLYLQLLALETPTDRGVRTWNGWTPTRHRKAAAALVDAGLAVADKRSRAGRGTFLPGPWASATKPFHPMETWKATFLGIRLVPGSLVVYYRPTLGRTLPELFTEAWDLVEQGAGPR
ncbi:hypothetical protein [Streptomyces sp. SID3343]|uniref:hypothetical protein n=1 Tax=Streptomyces sp. SID3343 TaxID=2690260 RepID=UPI00136C8DC9|nr:hypothetical protein [Streptomyces sp. SID3343]MYW02011.1 hypothetical protein [Streptomyces sp. SID3343]